MLSGRDFRWLPGLIVELHFLEKGFDNLGGNWD
jgi:hypothetical protein